MKTSTHMAAADDHEADLIQAFLADPNCFARAKAEGISAAHFLNPELRKIWCAGEAALKAGAEPDIAELIKHDAPDSVRRYLGGTSAYFKRAVAGLKNAHIGRLLADRSQRIKELALAGENEAAEELLRQPILGHAPTGLGQPRTAAQMLRKPTVKPSEIIAGVLYRGGTMMLSGPSKARKTYAFLDLGLSVAAGAPWLGFETAKAPVIYLNFELCGYSMDQRVAAICKAKGIGAPESFLQFNLRGKGATLNTLAVELPRLIHQHGAGLVIVDPWYKVSASSGAEENSNDGQARILADLERIVTSNGAALVIGHHFAKGDASGKNSIDRAAGAGAMARWGDAIVTMTEHEEADAMTLEFHLRDFAPVVKFAVRWVLPLWQSDSDLDPEKLKRRAGRNDEHPASEALRALEGQMTNGEWREAVGWPESTFRRKRDQLKQDGKVVEECGVWRKATP